MKEEVWKDIPGPEDATINYQISNHGRVRRLSYTAHFSNQVTSWEKTLPDKILKGSIDSHGYVQVKLRFYRQSECVEEPINALVHRLVADAFLPPPSKELVEECAKSGLKKFALITKTVIHSTMRNGILNGAHHPITMLNNKEIILVDMVIKTIATS